MTTNTDDKVLIGLTHGSDEPENVLISYLIGVEALRAGKKAEKSTTNGRNRYRRRCPGRLGDVYRRA